MTDKLAIEDRLDITDFFNRYCYLVDDNKQDDWLDLFTDDGVFDVPGLGCMAGRDQLRGLIQMVADGSGGQWRHQLTNILAQGGDQPGTAKVRAYGLVTDWHDGGKVSTFNNYLCDLRKVDGHWRIARLEAQPTQITV